MEGQTHPPAAPVGPAGEGKQADVTKDNWDKVRILGTAAMPFVVALLGWFFSSTLKSREVDAEYVNLAIQVLHNQDTAEVSEQLRVWAGQILDELGPVPMPVRLREAIEGGRVSLPVAVSIPSARLEIDFGPDMIVWLDGSRGHGPGVSGWVTRVSPGLHHVFWLDADSSQICEYQRVFGENESVYVTCDRRTREVRAAVSRFP